MTLATADLLKVQKPDGSKAHATAGGIANLQTGAQVKSKYEAEANTNAFTDAEKTKLAALDPNHFRGLFTSLAALQAVTGVAGDYGDVDTGVGSDVARYIWDVDDADWVQQTSGGGETAATVKSKYESNPDTNAYTDAASAKVDHITVTGPVDLDALQNANHAAVTIAANTGLQLNGQEIGDDYASLPAA